MKELPFARLLNNNLVGQVLLHLNANLITIEFNYAEARHTYELSFETDNDAEESFRRLTNDDTAEMINAFVEEIDGNSFADLVESDAISA